MTNVDVSIVVTFHHEGKYVVRTVQSLSEAAMFARDQGISVELVAVFDRADAPTKEAFAKADFANFNAVQEIDVNFGSLSLSRNSGCSLSSGTYIIINDGDDLVSSSYIARIVAAVRLKGETSIIHPKFSMAFGASYFIVEYFDQDRTFAPGMINQHLYTARISFHRSLLEKVQYTVVPPGRGYAYEDWHFNCEAMAAGYKFYAGEKVVGFYRQRSKSMRQEADRISSRQIPPSKLFAPNIYLRSFAEVMERYKRDPDFLRINSPVGLEILQDPDLMVEICRVNRIDPAVDIGHYHWDSLGIFNNLPITEVGSAYYRLCEFVGHGEFDEVVFLPDAPFLGSHIMESIIQAADEHKAARILVLSETSTDAFENLSRVTSIDLLALDPRLSKEHRDILCLKLIQACAPAARIQLSFSGFGRRFIAKFGHLLSSNSITYHRGTAKLPTDEKCDVDYEFITEHIDLVHRVVAADAKTMNSDRRRFRYGQSKWELAVEDQTRSLKVEH